MRLGLKALLSIILWGTVAWAQSTYGGLHGIVADAGGGVLASSKVGLLNEGTGELRSAVTLATGEYVFSQVIPGSYTISVENPGF